MVKTRQSIFSTIFSLFINIFLFIFQFIFIYLLIDHYGVDFSGFTRLNTALLSFVGSTDGGIGIMTVLFLIKPLLENDYYRINDILLTARKNYHKSFYITALLVLLITASLIIYYVILKGELIPIIDSSTATKGSYLPIWGMALIILSIASKNLLSLIWIGPYENLLQADQNNYINRLIILITDLLFYSLLFYLIMTINNPIYVFLVFLSYTIFKSSLIRLYAKIKYPWIDLKKGEIEERLSLKTFHISVYKIFISFFYNLDLIFAAILISFSSVAFISLYLILISAFRNIANSLIYSFKEYFAVISNKEGRVYWSDYQKFERYTIWSTGIVFIIQFLLSPYLAIALFSNLINGLTLDNTDKLFYKNLFTHQTFATITSLQTLIFLLAQPHNIMIYSKSFFNRIAFKSTVISTLAAITSFLVGVVFKYVGHSSDTTLLYSFTSTFIIFMFIHYLFLYYYSWSKLTYNSNIKDTIRNIPITILIVISAVLFKELVLLKNSNWELEITSNKPGGVYWQNFHNFIPLILTCTLYSIFVPSLLMSIFLPYWFISLIKNFIFNKLFNRKKQIQKKQEIDIFLHDIDGVYYKINTVDNNEKSVKTKKVYVLTHEKESTV